MIDYWKEASDITLRGAALLTLGEDPDLFDKWLESAGEPMSPEDTEFWPCGFSGRLAALKSAVRAGVMPSVKLVEDRFGNLSDNTLVLISEVRVWCRDKGIQLDQAETPDQPGRWPWGDYETRNLQLLARTAREFWSSYDASQPGTADTKEAIVRWLVDNGATKNVAEAIDKILRADGLPKGPRSGK